MSRVQIVDFTLHRDDDDDVQFTILTRPHDFYLSYNLYLQTTSDVMVELSYKELWISRHEGEHALIRRDSCNALSEDEAREILLMVYQSLEQLKTPIGR